MKKILVAILCLFFLGACSRGNEEEQAKVPGNELGLAVRSGDVVTLVSMPASVYKLTGLTEGLVCEPECFTAEEKITYQDLLPGEYTFFVLGNGRKDDEISLYTSGRKLKTICLNWWKYDTIPELFGGIVKANGSEEMMTVEMTRLVGSVKVNVLNHSEFQDLRLGLAYSGYNSEQILLGDYILEPRMQGGGELLVGKEFYLFPTKELLRGEIIARDENGQEYYFDFVSKYGVQRNKRLELNLTLNKATGIGRSANVVNTVTCVEEVSEF